MTDFNLEQTNERSLEILADIFDPYFELMKDKEFTKRYMNNVKDAIKYACKTHPKEVVEIAAVLEGIPVEKYVVNPFKLPIVLLSAIGTYKQISSDLFTSQAQSKDEASSGSATENTEADEQQSDS